MNRNTLVQTSWPEDSWLEREVAPIRFERDLRGAECYELGFEAGTQVDPDYCYQDLAYIYHFFGGIASQLESKLHVTDLDLEAILGSWLDNELQERKRGDCSFDENAFKKGWIAGVIDFISTHILIDWSRSIGK